LLVGLHGTQNTLEVARAKNARYLFTSTSEVYGDPLIHPQPESYGGNVDCMGKRSAYDQSKRGAEVLIKLYFEHYGVDTRIARLFNTYGPGMRLADGRVINNFLESLINNTPLKINGSGDQTRSFAYVDDTIDGIFRLIDNDALCNEPHITQRVFNLGNPDEFTINELAYKVNELSKKYFNREIPIIHRENPDMSDPRMRRPDISRAQTILGFMPRVSLDEGLEKSLQFFLNKHNKDYHEN
jgi:dTDP-glucose 4,6-dehydratase